MIDFIMTMQAHVAKELANATVERKAEVMERLIDSLALTISVMANGHAEAMSDLLAGAENHLNERAADHAKLAAFLASVRPVRS